MFRSSFNSLHEQTKAANDLLVRDNAYLPGPDGALSVPITGMRRQGVFPFSPPRVGAQGGASAAAAGLPANSNLVTDNINGKACTSAYIVWCIQRQKLQSCHAWPLMFKARRTFLFAAQLDSLVDIVGPTKTEMAAPDNQVLCPRKLDSHIRCACADQAQDTRARVAIFGSVRSI